MPSGITAGLTAMVRKEQMITFPYKLLSNQEGQFHKTGRNIFRAQIDLLKNKEQPSKVGFTVCPLYPSCLSILKSCPYL
jgi:hypothetical protein